MNVRLLILILVFISSSSLAARAQQQGNSGQEQDAAKTLEKLTGLWKMDEKNTFEHWQKKDGHLTARVFRVVDNDTLTTEIINILKIDGQLVYRAAVPDQNSGKPVDFRLTKATEKEVVFRNPAHDFPTTITYAFISSGRLKAIISGPVDGEEKSIEFLYTLQ